MSFSTRALRAAKIASIDEERDRLYAKIDEIEEKISRLDEAIPPELPEDYTWRLEQMGEKERQAHEQWKKIAANFHRSNAFLRKLFLEDAKFVEGESWPVGTQLRVRLPSEASPLPPHPEK